MSDARLISRLQAFDGKAVSILSEARVTCASEAGYWADLVKYTIDADHHVSAGATWMLKAELEDGVSLSPDLTETLVLSLAAITAWQAELHICQFAHLLVLTDAQAQSVSAWAKAFEQHKRPFLRGWSLSLRATLGARFESLRKDGASAVARAQDDEAASVRARARHMPDFG